MAKDDTWVIFVAIIAVAIVILSGMQFSTLPVNQVFRSAVWTDQYTLVLSEPLSGVWTEPRLSAQREATEILRNDWFSSTSLRSSGQMNFWKNLYDNWGITDFTTDKINFYYATPRYPKDQLSQSSQNILLTKVYTPMTPDQYDNPGIWPQDGKTYFRLVYVPSAWVEIKDFAIRKTECYLDYGQKYYGIPELFDDSQILCRVVLPSGGIQMPSNTKVYFKFNTATPITGNSEIIRSDLGYCGDTICQDIENSGTCPHDCVIAPETLIVSGCMDVLADNYNPSATNEDGSCTYTSIQTTDMGTGQTSSTPTPMPMTTPSDDLSRSWWIFGLIIIVVIGLFLWRR